MTRFDKIFWLLLLALGLALVALVYSASGQPVPKKPKVWKHAEVTQGMGAADLIAKAAVVPVLRVQEIEFKLPRTDYTNVWWALESAVIESVTDALPLRTYEWQIGADLPVIWQTELICVTNWVMTVTNHGEPVKLYRLKGRFHP